jgi:uncharacterized protein YaeQ
MSFLDGIFSFSIEINNVESNVYETIKLRATRHEAEGRDFFYARIFGYCHAYTPGLLLTNDATDPRIPAFSKVSLGGDFETWGGVGAVEARTIRHNRKSFRNARTLVYFYSQEQVHRFCHQMRGATENWVSGVRFYYIKPELITWLASFESARATWELTFTDASNLFISINEESMVSEIVELDIWSEYQRILTQAHV